MANRTFLELVRAWLPRIILGAVVGGVAATLATIILVPRTYESTATLLVGASLGSEPDYDRLTAFQVLARTYAEIATTRPVLERVIADVGVEETPEDLRKRVEARAIRDVNFVTVTARDGDANRAQAIANAVADELLQLASADGSAGSPLALIDPAAAAQEPSSPRPLLSLLLGALSGLAVVLGLAVLLEGDVGRRG
jgi:capsular polysaccharide biosynthesis protein